jgi:hypothetical protein
MRGIAGSSSLFPWGRSTSLTRSFGSILRYASVSIACSSREHSNSRWTRIVLPFLWLLPSLDNHLVCPAIALTRYPESVTGFRFRSGLRHLAAGSPKHPAESSSLSLRTGPSPPGTPHPASRRRSSVRLQAGERLLEKDFHLSDKTNLQTYCHARDCRGHVWK